MVSSLVQRVVIVFRRRCAQPQPFYFTSSAAFRICALLFLLLVAGCQQAPDLSLLDPGATVLAFGDSLTHGNGAAAGEDYPSRLEALIGRRVVNAGIPGEVTAEGLHRLPGVLDKVHPALLILCHGGNDFLRRTGEDRAAENLRGMIEAARSRGVEVVLVAVPRPGLLLDPAPFYDELAAEYHLPCEEEALADILADRDLKSDAVHPNAAGYRRLAAAVAELLVDAGAIPRLAARQ